MMWKIATLTPDMASRWARPVRRSSATSGWEYGGTSPVASERRYREPFVVPATRLIHSPVSRRARGNGLLHRSAPAVSGRKTTFAASAEKAYWAPCAIAAHSRGISPGFPIPRTGCRRPDGANACRERNGKVRIPDVQENGSQSDRFRTARQGDHRTVRGGGPSGIGDANLLDHPIEERLVVDVRQNVLRGDEGNPPGGQRAAQRGDGAGQRYLPEPEGGEAEGRQQQNPGDRESRRPGGQPEEEPGEECEEEQVQRPLPAERMVHGRSVTARPVPPLVPVLTLRAALVSEGGAPFVARRREPARLCPPFFLLRGSPGAYFVRSGAPSSLRHAPTATPENSRVPAAPHVRPVAPGDPTCRRSRAPACTGARSRKSSRRPKGEPAEPPQEGGRSEVKRSRAGSPHGEPRRSPALRGERSPALWAATRRAFVRQRTRRGCGGSGGR